MNDDEDYCASCWNHYESCDCVDSFAYGMDVDSVEVIGESAQPESITWYFLGNPALINKEAGKLVLGLCLKTPMFWSTHPPETAKPFLFSQTGEKTIMSDYNHNTGEWVTHTEYPVVSHEVLDTVDDRHVMPIVLFTPDYTSHDPRDPLHPDAKKTVYTKYPWEEDWIQSSLPLSRHTKMIYRIKLAALMVGIGLSIAAAALTGQPELVLAAIEDGVVQVLRFIAKHNKRLLMKLIPSGPIKDLVEKIPEIPTGWPTVNMPPGFVPDMPFQGVPTINIVGGKQAEEAAKFAGKWGSNHICVNGEDSPSVQTWMSFHPTTAAARCSSKYPYMPPLPTVDPMLVADIPGVKPQDPWRPGGKAPAGNPSGNAPADPLGNPVGGGAADPFGGHDPTKPVPAPKDPYGGSHKKHVWKDPVWRRNHGLPLDDPMDAPTKPSKKQKKHIWKDPRWRRDHGLTLDWPYGDKPSGSTDDGGPSHKGTSPAPTPPPAPITPDPTPDPAAPPVDSIPLSLQSTFRMANVWNTPGGVQDIASDSQQLTVNVRNLDLSELSLGTNQVFDFSTKSCVIRVRSGYSCVSAAVTTKLGCWYFKKTADPDTLSIIIDVTEFTAFINGLKCNGTVFGVVSDASSGKSTITIVMNIPVGVGLLTFDVVIIGFIPVITQELDLPFVVHQMYPVSPWLVKSSIYSDWLQDCKWLPDGSFPIRGHDNTVGYSYSSNAGMQIVQRTDKYFGHTVLLVQNVQCHTLSGCDPGVGSYGTDVSYYTSNGINTGLASISWTMFVDGGGQSAPHGLRLERQRGTQDLGALCGFLYDCPPTITPAASEGNMQFNSVAAARFPTDPHVVGELSLSYQSTLRIFNVTQVNGDKKLIQVVVNRTGNVPFSGNVTTGAAFAMENTKIVLPQGYLNNIVGEDTVLGCMFFQASDWGGYIQIDFDITGYFPRVKSCVVGGYTYDAFMSGSRVKIRVYSLVPSGYGIGKLNVKFFGDEYPLLSDIPITFSILQQYLATSSPLIGGQYNVANGGMHWFGGTPVNETDFSFLFDASTNVGMSVMRRSDYWPDFTVLYQGTMRVTRLLNPSPNASNYGTDVDSFVTNGRAIGNGSNEWSVIVMDPLEAGYSHWGLRLERQAIDEDFRLLGCGCFSNGINF